MYAATLLFNDTDTFSNSSSNSRAYITAIKRIKKELEITNTPFKDINLTPETTLTHAYNFNFVHWYLNDEISLAELLTLAIALTSLHHSSDDVSINSTWKTPLLRHNLDFSNAVLALFE